MPTTRVVCCICHQDMIKMNDIAIAYHTNVSPTIYSNWVCVTPDCDGQINIEEDK